MCHQSARTVCLRGKNSQTHSKLVIFTDAPDYFADNAGKPYALDVGLMLDWLLKRMSIDPDDVAYEYTLRCYGKGSLPTTKAARCVCIEECSRFRFAALARIRPRAIVALGQVSLEAFTGKTQVGEYEGQRLIPWEPVVRDYTSGIWCGYSINYALISPSDTYRIFRVIFKAAQEAGLKPRPNPNIAPFQWRNLI